EYVYRPGKTENEIVEENATEMDESGLFASIAAYREIGALGPPEGVLVVATTAGTPATKVLQAGDVIVNLDGQPVTKNEELLAIVGRHKVGDQLGVAFKRGTGEKQGSVRLVPSPDPERK